MSKSFRSTLLRYHQNRRQLNGQLFGILPLTVLYQLLQPAVKAVKASPASMSGDKVSLCENMFRTCLVFPPRWLFNSEALDIVLVHQVDALDDILDLSFNNKNDTVVTEIGIRAWEAVRGLLRKLMTKSAK